MYDSMNEWMCECVHVYMNMRVYMCECVGVCECVKHVSEII